MAAMNPESPESSPPMVAPAMRWSGVEIALLLVVLLIATGFRFNVIQRSLTYDELWHLGLSTGRGSPVGQVVADHVYLDPPRQTSLENAPPFYRVWTHMDGVLHPPLYVITLRLWRDLFGESDAAARSYSIVWSLLAIGFMFATVRATTDRYAAAMVTLAMAVAPTQIYLGVTVRGYEMLLGMASIAIWLMTRVERLGPTRRRTIALAAMTLPLMLTHYFAAGAVGAIVVYGFWRLISHRVAFAISLAICAGAYAVAWLPFALRQLDALGTGDAFLKVTNFNAFHEAVAIFAVPARLLVDSPEAIWVAGGAGVLLLVAAVAAWRWGGQPTALPLLIWIIGSIGFIAALDFSRATRHALFIRYFAIAAPAAFVLAAVVGRAIGRRFAVVGGAVLVIAAIVVPAPAGAVMNDSADYSMIARSLSRIATPDEAVLIWRATGTIDFSDSVFIHLSHEPGFFPRPVVKVESPLSADTLAMLPRRAWLVMPPVDAGALAQMLPGAKVLGVEEVPSQAMLFHVELRPGNELR
jgi:hypothetical protein